MSINLPTPNYLAITNKIGLALPILWCGCSMLIGSFYFSVSGSIFVSLGSLLVAWVSLKLVSFFLSFQQHSGVVSNETYDLIVKLVWFISVIGAFSISIKSIFSDEPQEAFYSVSFNIVYWGGALAAARKWGGHYVQNEPK